MSWWVIDSKGDRFIWFAVRSVLGLWDFWVFGVLGRVSEVI